MSGINNISGSSTPPIQHNPSQASEPPRLEIETVDQARDHWGNRITSLSQVSDEMEVLEQQAEKGHIRNETYRLLANALRDIHNTLQARADAEAQRAQLPVRPPLSNNNLPAELRQQQRELVPDPETGQMITLSALTMRELQRQRRSAP